MIRVAIDCVCLTVSGHAGYGQAGQDIVCAAASILAYAFAQRLADIGALDSNTFSAGDCRVCGIDCPGARQAMAFAAAGYRLLADAYPDHIQLYTASE